MSDKEREMEDLEVDEQSAEDVKGGYVSSTGTATDSALTAEQQAMQDAMSTTTKTTTTSTFSSKLKSFLGG